MAEWKTKRTYDEILYETYNGIAKITINRPEVHNAFTPKTVAEMIDAFADARDDQNVGVIVLAGAGDKAFCSGGDQKVRGHGGYVGMYWHAVCSSRSDNGSRSCIKAF